MWNREKYNALLTSIARQQNFKGTYVKNKEALYLLLSQQLYVSYDTVKGWTRAKSKGPGSVEDLKRLEDLLETKLTINTVEQMEYKEMKEMKYSEFVKTNIKKCYELMIDYVTSDDNESEEVYCCMRAELRKLKIAIPQEIYEKIEECADTYLDPIIYDHRNFFAELYTDDMGYFDEEGCFHLKDEASTMKHLGLYMEKMIWIKDQIEDFGLRELYPILVQ